MNGTRQNIHKYALLFLATLMSLNVASCRDSEMAVSPLPTVRQAVPLAHFPQTAITENDVGDLHNEIVLEYFRIRGGNATVNRQSFAVDVSAAVTRVFSRHALGVTAVPADIGDVIRWLTDLRQNDGFDVTAPTQRTSENLLTKLVDAGLLSSNDADTIARVIREHRRAAQGVSPDSRVPSLIEQIRSNNPGEDVLTFLSIFEASNTLWNGIERSPRDRDPDRRITWEDIKGWGKTVADGMSGIGVAALTGNKTAGVVAAATASLIFNEMAENPWEFGDQPCPDCVFPCYMGPCF